MEGNEKIKRYVCAMMKRENMSGEKLSKLAGVSSDSVYKFLNGKKTSACTVRTNYCPFSAWKSR